MSRALRICLMVFGPAPIALGSLFFVFLVSALFENPAKVSDLIGELGRLFRDADFWFIGILAAYIYTGLPSLIYMACIELLIKTGMEPRSWKLVAVSTLLGLLSGLIIGVVVTMGIIQFTILGGWVGFVIGLIIKVMPEQIRFRRRRRRSSKHPRDIVYD